LGRGGARAAAGALPRGGGHRHGAHRRARERGREVPRAADRPSGPAAGERLHPLSRRGRPRPRVLAGPDQALPRPARAPARPWARATARARREQRGAPPPARGAARLGAHRPAGLRPPPAEPAGARGGPAGDGAQEPAGAGARAARRSLDQLRPHLRDEATDAQRGGGGGLRARLLVAALEPRGDAGGGPARGAPERRDPVRAFLIVLDGVGIGALPDAAEYGDAGSHTLLHVAEASGGLRVPTLERLGLGHLASLPGVHAGSRPAGARGRLAERSKGKDSTTGHWEMTGLVLERPFPTYPQGFPVALLDRWSERIERGWFG